MGYEIDQWLLFSSLVFCIISFLFLFLVIEATISPAGGIISMAGGVV